MTAISLQETFHHISFPTWNETPIDATDFFRLLTDKIKDYPNVQKTILFGSYAYGAPSEESDLDIAVILDIDNKETYNQWVNLIDFTRPIWEMLALSIDLIVFSSDHYLQRLKDEFKFETEIERKGVVLFEQRAKVGI